MDDGVIQKFTANQDTTSFLSFLGDAAELGAKGAGLPVGARPIKGTFGLDSGLYYFTEENKIAKVEGP